jgi:SAM-dependent methyltransferase
VLDIREVAPGLTLDPAGYWLAQETMRPSYPAGGNHFCFGMEEESFWFAHRNRAIVAAVRRHPPASGPIFDVGAGNGFVAAALERAGFPTIAIEPDRDGAAKAVGRGLTGVVCGSLAASVFREQTAGAIGLFDVVEHVEDDRGFLASLRPFLRERGRLYVTTPAYRWLWSENDARSGHFRRYTMTTLDRALRAAGYRVEYETYLFWALPLPILLFRTIRARDGSSASRSRLQHKAGSATLRRAIEACFAFETRCIARGLTVPFGGSCLVVATRA